jgi:hypothetical protein
MDTSHPTIAAVLRAKGEADPQNERSTIRRELEAEAKGLILAARMHGFAVNLMHGTATVIDMKGGAT